MRRTLRGVLLGVLLGTILWVAALAQGPTVPPPLFIVGQTYTVVVDCFPEWVAQGQPLNPCFAEALTVQLVRPDGWVVVVDPTTGQQWTINPARVYAIQPQTDGQRAGP